MDDYTDAQVGDVFIICTGGWSSRRYLSKVERLTKTQIVLKDNEKFRKDSGRRVGDTYGGYIAKKATNADVVEITRERRLSQALNKLFSLTNVNTKTLLENIDSIIETATFIKENQK